MKGATFMDFTKVIYGEVEGISEAEAAKAYLDAHGIEYTEHVEDGYFVDSFHTFEFPKLTKGQMEAANNSTEILFYQ